MILGKGNSSSERKQGHFLKNFGTNSKKVFGKSLTNFVGKSLEQSLGAPLGNL